MTTPCAGVRVLKLRLTEATNTISRLQRENAELRRQLAAERQQGAEVPR